jgi:uncharacterized protein YbjT (DUF2867 family)
MKIVVIGGSGLIGTRLVGRLRQGGHDVIAASPASGVNAVSGDGLPEAMEGTHVVIDVSNSPSYEAKTAWDFFFAAGNNLLAAERAAGVGHHVVLSIVGTDRMQDSGYFRAKLLQEQIVRGSDRPHTIVRSTQFFEFMDRIAGFSTVDQIVRLSPAYVQPVAADDVVEFLAKTAMQAPVNGIVEVAGPHSFHLNNVVGRVLAAKLDERLVIADPDARYLGVQLDDVALVPSGTAMIAPTTLEEWMVREIPVPGAAGHSDLKAASAP